MTCIVGIADGGRVWIGGDSAGVAGMDMTVRADRKVFRNGPFIMGFTSSFRMGQLLSHRFTPPKRHVDQDVYAFMVTTFVDAVRDLFKAGGFAEDQRSAEKGGNFLVGYAGRVFEICSDYQVAENVEPFASCGCGSQVALGSLHSTSGLDMTVEDRLARALRAAEAFSAGVRGPFHIEVSSHED